MSNTPITDWQKIRLDEFPPEDQELILASICAEIEEKLIKATEALQFYANESNWKLNGPCDGNSSNFNGWTPAKKALKEIAELECYENSSSTQS